MDVYDNEGWLMNGIPDGEFEETTPEEAKQNYTEHSWLIENADNAGEIDWDDFNDFIDTYSNVTSSKNYDQEERNRIIDAADTFVREYAKYTGKPEEDGTVVLKESDNTCPSCGKPYAEDGRCYNDDCEEYDPLSQYFDVEESFDDDFSDEELASIYGGDTKYDMPDGIETPDETEARLAAEKAELNESTNDMIYLFPELTDEDLEMAKAYGLQFIGYNHGPNGEENNWVMRGTEASLNRFADKYLGYELHPDYLYYEDDFAGDIEAV